MLGAAGTRHSCAGGSARFWGSKRSRTLLHGPHGTSLSLGRALQCRLQQALRCAAQRAQRGAQPELSHSALGGWLAAGGSRAGGHGQAAMRHACQGVKHPSADRSCQHLVLHVPQLTSPTHLAAACPAGCASCTVPAISRPTVTAAASTLEASWAPQPHKPLSAPLPLRPACSKAQEGAGKVAQSS